MVSDCQLPVMVLLTRTAISTLLQPPIVRTGLLPHTSAPANGYKAPTSRDIPPVTLTNIHQVDPSVFQQYLAQIGPLYDALCRSNDDESRRRREEEESRQGPSTPDRRRSLDTSRSQKTKSRGMGTAPLSTIPSVYFDPDFRLENPRTFDVVSERSQVVRPGPDSSQPGRKLATNAILQEKLSWYLDTVEIHLVSSIFAASTTFFNALGSLQELHAEAATSVEKIHAVREDLSKIDHDMALDGLELVKLRRRRENVRRLGNAIAQLKEVIDSTAHCEKLVESGDLDAALDQLDDVERLICGESKGSHNLDLRGISALQSAPNDLSLLRRSIGVGYEKRFVDCLTSDLLSQVESVPNDDTLSRWGAALQRAHGPRRALSPAPTPISAFGEIRSRLEADLNGLTRAQHTAEAATSFKIAVLREMKSLIRRHLPSSSDDDTASVMSSSTQSGRQLSSQEKTSILARNLRQLDPEDAYVMLKKVYAGVSECIRRLSMQVKLLLDISSNFRSQSLARPNPLFLSPLTSPTQEQSPSIGSPIPTAQRDILEVLDLSSLLGQAVDIVQAQIVKVLKVRSEQTVHLSLDQFLRYFTLHRLFVNECEAISGRSGTALSNLVDDQIKEFVVTFADDQRYRIVQTMDADRWDAKDFGDAENDILLRVLESSTKDISLWTTTSRIWEPAEAPPPQPSTLAPSKDGNGKPRTAIIDDQKFILPQSALLLMRVLEEFQHLMAGIPGRVQDSCMKLLECLKLFNSRSAQLILGAGATRSAGLKNITTKHLALASQALSFIATLIPYVREYTRRYSSAPGLMVEFDKVRRLYQEHQTSIHEKLVDIMSSRATTHIGAMKKIDWDEKQENEGNDGDEMVSAYMEILVKETGTLHRVVSRHLPETTVMQIMDPVFTSYREQLGQAFAAVTVKSERGRQR